MEIVPTFLSLALALAGVFGTIGQSDVQRCEQPNGIHRHAS